MENTDTFFNNWETSFDLLMKIPLYLINQEFNMYYSHFSISQNIDKNDLVLYSQHKKDINPGCNAINNALKNFKSNSEQYFSDNKKYCEYLSYFLYDKFKKITNVINFEQLYKEINNNITRYDLKDQKCHIKEFYKFKDNFDSKKYLYFHSEMLYWVKEKYEEHFNQDHDFCKQCIQDSVTFYNNKIKNKYCENKESYETELQSFIDNFNKTKAFLESKGIQITPSIRELPAVPNCPAEESQITLVTESPGHSHSASQINPIPTDFHPDIPPMDNPNNGADTTAGIVLGTFSGISLLYLFFHKFTPFGSLISQKLGSTKKYFNLGEKSEELNLDAYENDDASLFNNEYHIQY
ncbi:PIR Superfamily Protein [Plasmodium ovale wallikeri]|uniref:PIR Superfamily Protein n=1 Tax=Plasmodium ovale wallikeri TaxID=864142 RepID=A0A1A9AKP5_PLAOA|nr:PIR Superfamily Protein [Plasmodium ovale wallikeri]